MKFQINHSAYIKIKYHRADDPSDLFRTTDQYISALPSNPYFLELAADASLDSISRTWIPLDAEAIAAQAKLITSVSSAKTMSVSGSDASLLKLIHALPAEDAEAMMKSLVKRVEEAVPVILEEADTMKAAGDEVVARQKAAVKGK